MLPVLECGENHEVSSMEAHANAKPISSAAPMSNLPGPKGDLGMHQRTRANQIRGRLCIYGLVYPGSIYMPCYGEVEGLWGRPHDW
jgi:hypothetical protein